MQVLSPAKLSRIRELNDNLRSTFTGGQVVITHGVAAICKEVRAEILRRVREFSRFTSGNDPHEEHDMGAIIIGGETFIWKIDYLDRQLRFASEDPSDPSKTTRVLTVMLAYEY